MSNLIFGVSGIYLICSGHIYIGIILVIFALIPGSLFSPNN